MTRKNLKKQRNDRFAEEVVAAVRSDFSERQQRRQGLEIAWRLNQCFLAGKQNLVVSPNLQIEEESGSFWWQKNDSFNHISPIIDSRLAKLSRVKPCMNVRAKLGNDEDVMSAKLASKLLASVSSRVNLSKLLGEANVWSETLGSVFYRIDWNNDKGLKIDEKEHEGDVDISIISPFYVYPANLYEENLSEQSSLIIAPGAACGKTAAAWIGYHSKSSQPD